MGDGESRGVRMVRVGKTRQTKTGMSKEYGLVVLGRNGRGKSDKVGEGCVGFAGECARG